MAFCGKCGASLADQGADPIADQERRRLTVLFCDMVGSTRLSEQMDLEEFEHLVRRYQEVCSEAAHRHDGFIAHYLGDGIIVYFGYPQAAVDAPAQAVRAGLAILAAVAQLNAGEAAPAATVAVRIGIATGEVVAGDLVGDHVIERAAIRGVAPSLAARLQAEVRPDTILIAAETRRSIGDGFELLDKGPIVPRGLTQAERVFEVVAERSAAAPAFEIAAAAGRVPGGDLVGRDEELALLGRLWAEVGDGGRVVVVYGEAGIGKSRLVQDFHRRTQGGQGRTRVHLSMTCSPYHRESAFHPIADALRRLLGIGVDTPPAVALACLERLVAKAGLSRPEAVQLLASVLLIDVGHAYPPLILAPARRRERLLDIFAALLRRGTRQRPLPLLVVVEDFQWADPSTAETLLTLFRLVVPDSPVLCLITQRTEHAAPRLAEAADHVIKLNRLGQPSVERLIGAVAGGADLPPDVLRAIMDRADGVPLFVEELTKNAVEALATQETMRGQGSVPVSLLDLFVARLDRMTHGKPVAQVASVIGRRFRRRLLLRVAPMPEDQLALGLQELIAAGLVCADGPPEEESYLFRHALMRDAAYETLLMRVRRRLHYGIGSAIAEDFPALAAAEPELLAQHFTLGEQWREAVGAWIAAGQAAQRRLDLDEAAAHFLHGLELLERLPPTADRDSCELALQAGVGAVHMLLRGYGAPEVRRAHDRALSLSEGRSDDPDIFPIVWGAWPFRIASGAKGFGQDAADRLTQIAETIGDRCLLMLAHTAQAATSCVRGEFATCEREARQALALYDAGQDRVLAFRYTIDPGLLSLMFLTHALWIQGRSAEADAVAEQCLAATEALGYAFVKPYVLVWGGVPLFYARRDERLVAQMRSAVATARENRLDFWAISGECWLAMILIAQGELDRGMTALEASLGMYEATGAGLTRSYLQAHLAVARARTGGMLQARTLIADALAEDEQAGFGIYSAEIRRLRGKVLLAAAGSSETAAAERCFKEALAIASRQGAHAWGLRAALDLARLRVRDGREREALTVLLPALGRVVAGHEAPEHEAARRLAAELTCHAEAVGQVEPKLSATVPAGA